MNTFIKFLLIITAIISFVHPTYATHNRAGEIVYKHISGYKYEIIVYTYCYTETEADRDELEVDCGDGTGKITVTRTVKTNLDNINTVSFSYLRKNEYHGEHTFSGPGTYVLYMEDPNRNDGVSNIPNSVNVVFAIKTTLIINAFTGSNNSPVLLNAPMDKAALNRTFVHNPGAYDPDGDSLSYRIAICLQQDGQEIVGYSLPPVTDSIYVNPTTGDFVWEKPSRIGTYNVAMWIEEWRNGIKIGQVLRDIQVEVIDTDNHSPVINQVANQCVLAGEKIEFDVTATDPDGDLMKMEASGGPFVVTPAATFTVNDIWTKNPTGHFEWQTGRTHIRNMPYEALIKVVDNDKKVPLTSYSTIRIRVIAPKPNITDIESTNSSIKLEWDKGGNYNATGYRIYRKDNKWEEFSPGMCETGVPSSSGYVLVAEIHNGNDTVYVDDDHGKGLPSGFRYCYRVTATFADGAESQASEPSCKVLVRGMIVMSKASVSATSETDGVVEVEWSEPIEPVDPLLMPPPYCYHLFTARGLYDGIFGNAKQFDGIDNTTYTDTKVDTKNKASLYKVAFANWDEDNNTYHDNGAGTDDASTVFISLTPSDRRVTITHECTVPWKNEKYEIYRKDPDSETFKLVGETTTGTYIDYNLENGLEYGYKMKTYGYYSAPGLPDDIQNWSQEAYATPIDTVAPCVKVNVKSNCDEKYNQLRWHPDTICGLGIERYIIYYSETIDGTLTKLDETKPDVNQYNHYPTTGMAGCYFVTARDSAGNEGIPEARVCVDQCDYYSLPNVFTPNGDGKNDLFHPFPYQFVDHIEITITNRWGKVVFTTTDPDINWDGNDKNTGSLVPDGVYFYRCIVYEHRLTGIEDRELKGFITVFTQKSKSTY